KTLIAAEHRPQVILAEPRLFPTERAPRLVPAERLTRLLPTETSPRLVSTGRLPWLIPAKEGARLRSVPNPCFSIIQAVAVALRPFAPLGPLLAPLGLAPVVGTAAVALEIGIARPGVGVFRRGAIARGGRFSACERLRRRGRRFRLRIYIRLGLFRFG